MQSYPIEGIAQHTIAATTSLLALTLLCGQHLGQTFTALVGQRLHLARGEDAHTSCKVGEGCILVI